MQLCIVRQRAEGKIAMYSIVSRQGNNMRHAYPVDNIPREDVARYFYAILHHPDIENLAITMVPSAPDGTWADVAVDLFPLPLIDVYMKEFERDIGSVNAVSLYKGDSLMFQYRPLDEEFVIIIPGHSSCNINELEVNVIPGAICHNARR